MARVRVVEVRCDRCKRVEHIPSNDAPSSDGEAKPSVFVAQLGTAAAVRFEDLCGPCTSTIDGYLALIAKKPEKFSPNRKKGEAKKKGEPVAPPSTSVTPPLGKHDRDAGAKFRTPGPAR